MAGLFSDCPQDRQQRSTSSFQVRVDAFVLELSLGLSSGHHRDLLFLG
jgi:hypothetical protein